MQSVGNRGPIRSASVRPWHVVAASLGVILLALGGAIAQNGTRTNSAEVKAKDLVYNWDTNEMKFSGNCTLTIFAGYDASMTAPTMQVKLSETNDRILRLVADGVVHFNVLTKPGEDGVRRKIVASAQQQAIYNEDTQTVVLSGGAVADITTVGSDRQAAHFTGQTLTANLKTSQLIVNDANLKVHTPLGD